MSEIELGQARHSVPSDQRQVLCLSGGGYRGLYTGLLLEALEDKAKRPLVDVFDVIAGTSVGGLLAAGLALKMSSADIREALESHGPKIFDRRIGWGQFRINVRNPFRRFYRAKYAKQPLLDAINDMFGDKAQDRLDDLETPLILTAVNTKTGAPVLLKSRGLAGSSSSGVQLRDALLATAAAPTFFPPHSFGGETLVDGGLIANAPDMVAVTETIRNLGSDVQDVRALSIGTASSPHEIVNTGKAPGLLSWLIARGLVQLTLSAQEALAVDQCSVLLGERYLRLDNLPSAADQAKIGLDRADGKANAALRRAAETTIKSFEDQNRAAIRRFLSHQSLGPRRGPIG